MRFWDLVQLSLGSWRRQKTRSALTLLGVVLGTCMLAVSLSIGEGVKRAMRDHFRKNDQLRRIVVHPDFNEPEDESGIPPEAVAVEGAMNPERRERIRKELIRRWHAQHARRVPVPLNRAMLEQLAALPHVERVTPVIGEQGRCQCGDKTRDVRIQSGTAPSEGLQKRLIAGALFQSIDEPAIIVHEFLLYELGIRDDAAIDRLIGTKVTLEVTNVNRGPQLLWMFNAPVGALSADEAAVIDKATRLLPKVLDRIDLTESEKQLLQQLLKRRDPTIPEPKRVVIRQDFTVAGVIRIVERKEDIRWRLEDSFPYADVVVPAETMQALCDQLPRRQETGYDTAILRVDREENVREVIEHIKRTGLAHYSAVDFVDSVLREIRLIRYFTSFIAFIALLVAALGITNTMVTSVLERIQEIGIMKAVGARDRHIQAIFLGEGAMIGLLGGLLGMLTAWLVSFPGDHFGHKIMEEQMREAMSQTIFAFPAWLLISIPVFATLVTTLAAFYPAHRAARIDPVAALRHE